MGSPFVAGAAGEVVASWHPDFSAGQAVYGYFSWSEHVLVDVEFNRTISKPVISIPPGVSRGDFVTLSLSVGAPAPRARTD